MGPGRPALHLWIVGRGKTSLTGDNDDAGRLANPTINGDVDWQDSLDDGGVGDQMLGHETGFLAARANAVDGKGLVGQQELD